MTDQEQYWLFGIGPLDEAGAKAFRAELQRRLGEPFEFELYDPRLWYPAIWDSPAVRSAALVFDTALAAATLSPEMTVIATSLLGDLRDWLGDGDDPRRERRAPDAADAARERRLTSDCDWLFEIGPFAEPDARDFPNRLRREIGDSPQVEFYDDRVWSARAWDVHTVLGAVAALEAGLTAATFSRGIEQTARALLDDMRQWLQHHTRERN